MKKLLTLTPAIQRIQRATKASRVHVLFFIVTLMFAFSVKAQTPGALDTSFNPTDVGFGFGDGANSFVYSLALQPDGKVIIGGLFSTYNGTSRNRIARLNADGTLDNTFNPGTGANDGVLSLALQPDGKMIIGGNFITYNGTSRNFIARLNADGTLDNTFNPGTGANDQVQTLALQPDGKVIIGGFFTSYNGTPQNKIARLNADGTLDNTFNPGTGANSEVYSLALQPDGKVLIGGTFDAYNGTSRNYIARLNADGTLDNTFNPGTGANSRVRTLALQPDGKVIIGGRFTTYNGTSRDYIARLNADGTLDNTFNPGTGANDQVQTLALQPDGKVIIGGDFTSYNGTSRNRIARLNADGTLDNTFNPGTGTNSEVYSLALQPDGKVIIGGEFTTYNGTSRNYIARLNADDTLDNTFNPGTGASSIVLTLALQPDGKVIIGGFFTTYNGTSRNYIARLNADGTLDNTFNPGTGANSAVQTLALQPDGKVIIGGDFTTYNGTSRNRIARLNADGTIDNTFNPGTGANSTVLTLALQPDGKVLIGGAFTSFNGTSRNRIARLNADGTLDNTFNPGTGANSTVRTIALQPDGKVLIGGNFTTYNGTSQNRIARLNVDGTLDNTFNPGTGSNGSVFSLALQPDGKVLIGGQFTTYNGTSRNFIARLNADGTLDNTFNPGTGANSIVYSFALQPDGKVIIGGSFGTYNGTSQNRIARLNVDGTLDNTFNPGTGANSIVYSLALQPDGKVLIGGQFTGFNDIGRNRIARVFGDLPPPVVTAASGITQTSFTANWNAVSGATGYRLDVSADNFATFVTGYNDKVVTGTSDAVTGLSINTAYKYRVRAVNAGGTSANSNVIDVTTLVNPPAATAATTITQTGFTANWNAVTGATGYRLDVSADNFATFVTGFSDKTVSGTSEAVTGLTANTAYKYRVRAVNAGGTSANSNVIDVTTLVNPPAATAATTITQTGFTANWNAVTGATGYRLDVSADNFATFVTGFNDKAASGTSDAVTGLAANTAYKYRVRAVNANGTSANSNVIDVTTLAKQDQTITFAALPDRTIGDAAFTLSATASSALAVSFESLTTSKVTVSGNTVTMVAPGTATIRAKQDGNASFNAAPNVDRTFCIRPAKPTITLTNANTETPTLTSSATAGNQWFLNGTAITGATNATLTVTQAGVYTVRSTIETCASELSNAQAIIVTGDIASGTDALQVYPNPASDRVYVSLKSFARGSEVHLRLVDMNGRVLQKQIGQGGETVELSMAGYAGGAYLVTAEQGRLREQVKIVKE
jgi:uncharacterized delta-60 repeat protein